MLILLLIIPVTVVAFVVSKPSKRSSLLMSTSSLECNDMTRESLQGKNVILTGASSGLGKSLALQLARCNVKTLVLSGRNLEQLESVKSKCEEMIANDSSCIEIATCDLSDEASVNNFSNKAMEICNETADVLILCGGISSRSSFLETKHDVDKMLMQGMTYDRSFCSFHCFIIIAKFLFNANQRNSFLVLKWNVCCNQCSSNS